MSVGHKFALILFIYIFELWEKERLAAQQQAHAVQIFATRIPIFVTAILKFSR